MNVEAPAMLPANEYPQEKKFLIPNVPNVITYTFGTIFGLLIISSLFLKGDGYRPSNEE